VEALSFKKHVTLAMLRQAIEEAAVGLNIPSATVATLIDQAWDKLSVLPSPLVESPRSNDR
jgi:hypothetical protein